MNGYLISGWLNGREKLNRTGYHLFHRKTGSDSRFDSISPQDTSLNTPGWATQLWDDGASHPYNHRTEASDDRVATVTRERKILGPDDIETSKKRSDSPHLKPVVRLPKLAPPAWQLYFTDWIQRQQTSASTRKLNVAQAAKEAELEYASLSKEDKEPYKRRSRAMKETRERELSAYMRTLTPDDIKCENAYRTAQRKSGKSRKDNIEDLNAPKKPLSAYFMFLQRIKTNPYMVQEIFGDETETIKKSVLAAAKWRAMTDDERKPYFAQAEQEKIE
ncbi:HMG-box [Mycena floridula]|nr:HMG-box [Mycena floridula]